MISCYDIINLEEVVYHVNHRYLYDIKDLDIIDPTDLMLSVRRKDNVNLLCMYIVIGNMDVTHKQAKKWINGYFNYSKPGDILSVSYKAFPELNCKGLLVAFPIDRIILDDENIAATLL